MSVVLKFKFDNLGLVLAMALKFHTRVAKGLIKTKFQKDFWANSYVCRSCRGKTGRGPWGQLLGAIFVFYSFGKSKETFTLITVNNLKQFFIPTLFFLDSVRRDT